MKFCISFTVILAVLICGAGANAHNSRKESQVKLGDRTEYLDPFLKLMINSLIEVIADGVPWLGIPGMDPLNVPDILLDMTDPKLKIQGEITKTQVAGLRSLKVTHLETDLLGYRAEIGMQLGGMTINGDYDIDGLAAYIFPIYGKGAYNMTISGLRFTSRSELVMVGPYLQLKTTLLDLGIDEFKVKFEGLLGGGDLGDTLNEIINIIGLKIFELIKPTIQDNLVRAQQQFLNSKLLEVTLEEILAGNVPTDINGVLSSFRTPFQNPLADAGPYVDEVLANLRHEMIMNDLDRIVLPDQILAFSRKILGVTWHGEASIYGGLVLGLATIHRSGPVTLDVENGDIVFDATLEINDGILHGDMVVKFMNLGPKAVIKGTLKRVGIQIKCRIAGGLDKVSLEIFNIKDLGLLSIDISGLGLVLNFLVEIVSEFIGNLVKGLVANVLEGAISNLLTDIISSTLYTPTLLAIEHRQLVQPARNFEIVL